MYGKGNLVPVIATFDNQVQYHGSLAKMTDMLAAGKKEPRQQYLIC